MLEVFGLSNAELGDIFAVYGITAMLAYFPGGMIADQYSARKLMSGSLLATAAGGLYLAQVPGRTGLILLFAYWGLTSILLFWAAMIRATREWGGAPAQGRAFGFLDGGRGLVAASTAVLAATVLGMGLPVKPELAMDHERYRALQTVIYFYTALTFATAVLVWRCIPDSIRDTGPPANPAAGINRVWRLRVVWLQAIVVVCAYCGYKGLDYYGLYAVETLGLNELQAAQFTSVASYLRPVAAVAAGILVDRWTAGRVIGSGFLVLLSGYAFLAFLFPSPLMNMFLFANILLTFFAVFAIRGVYFALLEETRVPAVLTGTAVGLVSLIGFTPDIFFAPVAGRLLDSAPGITGFHHFFSLLAAVSIIGLAATAGLLWGKRKDRPAIPVYYANKEKR